MSSLETQLSGADIARATKLQSGTLYPILLRLEQAKWLESRWEAGNPHDLGRPRRRYYRLTGLGARSARAAFRDVASSIGIGGLAWQ
ncbi:MAG TPA: helix-turn-helix transcriptional regulator [Terriglobia bacterium]|nr:helix-turn-helix transcriptional regulator [Terriglobia bacterium]